MITVLSPSKTLDYTTPFKIKKFTQPQFLAQSSILIERCRQLSLQQIVMLMKISPALAQINHDRFAKWQQPFTPNNARAAIFAFKGEVYEGLQVEDFTEQDLNFAQANIGILSGLYGLLRPLDLIQPYRLEMGIRLDNPKGNNLYQFWENTLTTMLNQQLAEQANPYLINLASDEYFKSINIKRLNFPVIKPVFLDQKGLEYKVISFYAKKARGLMSRFIIKNQIDSPKQLLEFNLDGYHFDKNRSTETELIFIRPQRNDT
ncbi:MAG: peroxide stress protein YaaA [Candidatus Schmidhempelia sp.]|nr:peroxide stress protein YaaA [Candidatus Schmidhempelia sp.]